MNDNNPYQRPMVWWTIWGALLMGIFVIYFTLGSSIKAASTVDPNSIAWLLGFVPVAASCVVRWLTLPRLPNAQVAFPLFVVGLALAEGSCFFGIFLFPAHKLPLFITSAVGIFQFIPLFAGRYSSGNR